MADNMMAGNIIILSTAETTSDMFSKNLSKAHY